MNTTWPSRLVRPRKWICSSCRCSAHLPSSPDARIRPFKTTRDFSTSPSLFSDRAPKRGKLPDFPARTRFAPSPTGNLHLGSIRTALFNYLLAKATKGQFLLRIEDTDAKRTVPGAEERLYEDLKWAGLQWDEGPVVGGPYGPYRQSERLEIYQSHIQHLLQTGHAYHCFCSPERIDELNRRRHAKGLNLGYDRKCSHLPKHQVQEMVSAGESYVIRFLAPEVWPRYRDLIYGQTGHGANKTKKLLVDEPVFEDSILMKSDGYPTYHWANICDDHDMHISHVVRGSEWMSSTPLHVALYQAMNWEPPSYAHVPLLVDANRQKLSKRNFDSDISTFREQQIFPEALLNFASLLGWSHQEKSDVMDLEQLIALFDLKITKGNTIVAPNKLRYLQEHHAQRRITAGGEEAEQMIRDAAVAILNRYGAGRVVTIIGDLPLRDFIASLLRLGSFPFLSATDFATHLSVFFDPLPSTLPAFQISEHDMHLLHPLRVAATTFTLIPEAQWTEANHRTTLIALETPPDETLTASAWKKLLYSYLRWAILGGKRGPPIAHSMSLLERGECVERIQSANLQSRELETRATKPVLDRQGWKGDGDGKRRVGKEYDWKPHSL